ncbi:MAG: C39 family peptidase [Akkermansiaceae bacterium]|nr:C39 family peptidase [Akkermansiaceae bacterium]
MAIPLFSYLRIVLYAMGLACAPMVHAQVGENLEVDQTDTDLVSVLLAPSVWEGAQEVPGKWVTISNQGDKKTCELKSMGRFFGARPQQVLAYYQADKLVRMDVTYLETGNVFGYRKSREDAYVRDKLSEKEVREMKDKEDLEAAGRKQEFEKLFGDLEKSIPMALEAFCGAPGKKVSIGRDRMLKVRATEFVSPSLRFRFSAEEDQLILLAIIPAEVTGNKLVTQTGSDRRRDIKAGPEKLPNGDVVIRNIPMVNQGSRGYCAMGTLAMIMQYYSVNVNIDQLAAAAGYQEGSVEHASIVPIYESAAKEGKLKLQVVTPPLKARQLIKEVDRGQPVLIWRYFSRERDEVHSDFAETFATDPSAVLPDPKKDKEEEERWAGRSNGGHASIVTGYNRERGEILFTESWGENKRNRRMRVEEMEHSGYLYFLFEP